MLRETRSQFIVLGGRFMIRRGCVVVAAVLSFGVLTGSLATAQEAGDTVSGTTAFYAKSTTTRLLYWRSRLDTVERLTHKSWASQSRWATTFPRLRREMVVTASISTSAIDFPRSLSLATIAARVSCGSARKNLLVRTLPPDGLADPGIPHQLQRRPPSTQFYRQKPQPVEIVSNIDVHILALLPYHHA